MAAPYPQVVLLGDSLLQQATDIEDGYAFQAAMQSHCIRRYDVVNRGFSGYNTSQILKILPDIFPELSSSSTAPKMAYLIVLLGANDAAVTMPVDSQHVPLEQFEANLKTIITHPRIAAHKPKVILVTPPPLDEIRATPIDLARGSPHGARQAKISASYSEAVRRVAAELETDVAAVPGGLVLVDLWRALMDVAVSKTPGFDAVGGRLLGDPASGTSGYLEKLLPDGLHLSGEAYQILFNALLPHIKPEHASPTDEDWVFSEWRTAPWLDN